MQANIAEELFELSIHKALYWKQKKTLICGDLHIGKVAHFRKNGIQVPAAARMDTLERLGACLEEYRPERLLILGDLFHSSHDAEWEEFGTFLGKYHDFSVVLIIGNHDRLHNQHYENYNIHTVHTPLLEAPFIFSHEPLTEVEIPQGMINMHAHIHPGVQLQGKGHQRIKLPCLHWQNNQITIPAFGGFTGKHIIQPNKTDQVWAYTPREVIAFSVPNK